jgi:hypothetical protein
VIFSLVRPNGTVECVITLATLEAHFWLEPRASDARILKTFQDGYGRIRAISDRKLLAHPAARLELTTVGTGQNRSRAHALRVLGFE